MEPLSSCGPAAAGGGGGSGPPARIHAPLGPLLPSTCRRGAGDLVEASGDNVNLFLPGSEPPIPRNFHRTVRISENAGRQNQLERRPAISTMLIF